MLAVFDEQQEKVIGIIDTEAFAPEHFTAERLGVLAQLCFQLARHLLVK